MMGDVELTGVPKTLLLTLRARADEQARPDALFRDEHAARWAARLPWDDSLARWYDSRYQTGIALRTHRFDDIVERFVAGRPGAVVVELAAGLSSRYYRVGQGRVRWVELDLPEVIALRRRLDAESDAHRFVAASVLDPRWVEQVPLSAPEDLLILTEGLLMYLDAAEVAALVRLLRGNFAGAAWAFDVFGHRFRRVVAPHAASAGAPLRWSVTNEGDVARLGLRVREVWPIFHESPQRWGWVRWLRWLPAVRNAQLILETTLPPLDSPPPAGG